MGTPTTSSRPTLREIVSDRSLALMLALGFSSGLPFLLVFSTQSFRLREANVPLHQIGLFSYVALCYTFKFLWSPAIDTLDVPLLSQRLGRRRAWMLVAQAGIVCGLLGLALGDPTRSLTWIVACSFFTAFAAATQDIVVDGWRIDAAPQERQGMMSATYQLGFRLALLSAGAGALYIADLASWRFAYCVMAALMAIGITAGLLSPRQPDRVAAIRRRGFLETLGVSFAEPVADLVRRHGAWLIAILLLVALYRLPDFVSGVMANPLYIDLHFSKSDIATISKLYGVWIGIAGAFAGGFAVSRLRLMPTLLIGGIAASASHLCLALLAANGHSLPLLTLAVCVENFAGGFAGTALIAYMSSLTSPLLAASQYALLSSLYALPGKIVGGLSGLMVERFGYAHFFIGTSMIGIPVFFLGLAVWLGRRDRPLVSGERTGDGVPNREAG